MGNGVGEFDSIHFIPFVWFFWESVMSSGRQGGDAELRERERVV